MRGRISLREAGKNSSVYHPRVFLSARECHRAGDDSASEKRSFSLVFCFGCFGIVVPCSLRRTTCPRFARDDNSLWYPALSFRAKGEEMALQPSQLEQFPMLNWDDVASQSSAVIQRSLERALETQDGACLTDQERYALASSEGADLLALLVAADTLRRDVVGNIVTYVVNRNINFTNICFVGCKFCAFSRGPREADSYFHSLED